MTSGSDSAAGTVFDYAARHTGVAGYVPTDVFAAFRQLHQVEHYALNVLLLCTEAMSYLRGCPGPSVGSLQSQSPSRSGTCRAGVQHVQETSQWRESAEDARSSVHAKRVARYCCGYVEKPDSEYCRTYL